MTWNFLFGSSMLNLLRLSASVRQLFKLFTKGFVVGNQWKSDLKSDIPKLEKFIIVYICNIYIYIHISKHSMTFLDPFMVDCGKFNSQKP